MKALTLDQIVDAALEHNYNAHSVRAVQIVEAAGKGFLPDGIRPKILFERHWFHKLTKGKYSALHPDISNAKAGGYVGGSAEWARLDRAIALDRNAALQSASWGIGQVMGFHFKLLGFQTVQQMVNAAYESEAAQLRMMLKFISLNPILHKVMLKATPTPEDWKVFARGYNGSAYAKNQYDLKLANAYAKCLTA